MIPHPFAARDCDRLPHHGSIKLEWLKFLGRAFARAAGSRTRHIIAEFAFGLAEFISAQALPVSPIYLRCAADWPRAVLIAIAPVFLSSSKTGVETMTEIVNVWRWTGALSSEWTDINVKQSNWTLLDGTASVPGFPEFDGDIAVVDQSASITAVHGTGTARELQIVNGVTVTFAAGHFGFGGGGNDGFLIDDNSTLVIASAVSVSDHDGYDIVGLDNGSDSLQINGSLGSTTGLSDFGLIVGAGTNTTGDITVDSGTLLVNKSGSGGSLDGQLIVGEDGDGSVSLTSNSLFFVDTAIVGENDGSTGDITLDNSIWGGSSLLVGGGGTGKVTIKNDATAAITNVTIGPKGELDVTDIAGQVSSLMVPNLTLSFGTLTVSGGGEVDVAGGLVRGAVDVGTTMTGLGTINGDLIVNAGGVVKADQPLDGKLVVNGNITGGGEIDPLRTFEANGTIAAGITFAFTAPSAGTKAGVLQLDVPRGDDGVITGFAVGNTIDIEGLRFTDALFTPGTGGDPGTLTLSGTDAPLQLKIDGDYLPDSFIATPGTTDTLVTLTPCYCPGTLIRTRRGDKPVETLEIGDEVMTLSGAARPIKWIGRRGYSGRFIIGRKDVLPVCIRAGAIDREEPRRDLWISPHHAMYLEGVLIEAKDLINGVSIVQAEHVEEVEYFHIELDTHDVIIAEGALSESYLDDDNRFMFNNAKDYCARYEPAGTPPQYCAPRLQDGYEVEAARQRIDARAGLGVAEGEGIGALRGHVDDVSASRIAGWAQAIDHREAPVCLDIYAGERLIGQVLANHYREDLRKAGLGSGCHAFEFTPPAGLSLAPDAIEVRRSLDGVRLEASSTERDRRRCDGLTRVKFYRRAAHG
jgi:hypothetical protein